MAKIKVKAFAIMRDCGDGSQSCKIVATKQMALDNLGFSSEEDMKENYTCFYENGGFQEVEMEIEEVDGVWTISKGFSVNSDNCEMS
jgi:hypothetical protein